MRQRHWLQSVYNKRRNVSPPHARALFVDREMCARPRWHQSCAQVEVSEVAARASKKQALALSLSMSSASSDGHGEMTSAFQVRRSNCAACMT